MSWSARQLEMLERMALGPVWTSRRAAPMQEDLQQVVDEAQAPEAQAPAEPAAASVAAPAWYDREASPEAGAGRAPLDPVPVPVAANAGADEERVVDQFPESPATAPSVARTVPDNAPLQPARPADRIAPGTTGKDWPELEQSVSACVACGLCQGRHKTVFGVGDRKATWLFVGEGPGRQEDMQGEPFVGPAGKLLDNMLKALDLSRTSDAFIANIVKCRPTADDGRDRPPTPQEVEACLPFLQRQIELLQPDVIVALGRIAAVSLLGLPPDTSVGSLRGKLHRYQGKPLVVTYHPAYLLRQPADKARAWRDLCMARAAHEQS